MKYKKQKKYAGFFRHTSYVIRHTVPERGFTLIETLVAISLLTIAIVAPMSLTTQSLATAYYARDQITAFYLAQEGIEGVRTIRDAQILCIAQNSCAGSTDLFGPIPGNDTPFTIDTLKPLDEEIAACSGTCQPLETDDTSTFYGYGLGTPTHFTRTVRACYIQQDGTCSSVVSDEMRVSVTITWKTGVFQERVFTISSDLYRWVVTGSGA